MFLINILGSIMSWCYDIFSNYGLAIILFTLFSKIILLPMSIWVQKNSIKMVKMQPDINKVKINYFGDKDKIAEEQDKLYKSEKYNPFASLIPLIVQILLLLGLVEVINNPLTHIIKAPANICEKAITIVSENNEEINKEESTIQLEIVKDIKNDDIEKYGDLLNENNIIEKTKDLNLKFFGFDLSWITTRKGRNFNINTNYCGIKCFNSMYSTE